MKYEALALTTRGESLLPLGRKREAIADLRQAVEVARPVGDPAMFFHAAAALLRVEGDNALAADTLLAAERICSNLPEEMQACFQAAEPVQFVYKLTGPRASRPVPRPSYPDGLSQREVEVLGLIAAGKSNREIAEALVLSVRTVERHIANIYAKTDVRTKAQATAYALRHNLS